MSGKDDDRRLKLFAIDESRLRDLFDESRACGARFISVSSDDARIPPDAQILRIYHSWERGAIVLTVRHNSFDAVPAGETIPFAGAPYVDMTVREVTADDREKWLRSEVDRLFMIADDQRKSLREHRTALRQLIAAMKAWGHDEDGLPESAVPAFELAQSMVSGE